MALPQNIQLAGFDLDPAEVSIIHDIISSYTKKIEEKASYDKIRLRLKKSQHGKAFLHEVQAMLVADGKNFNTKVSDYNLFSAMSEVFEKLLNEITHKKRTYKDKEKS